MGVKALAMQEPTTALLYTCLIDQVREFRARHWNFTKEYIIKHSSHPVATGGSPIVTWLPNQLRTVLTCMMEAGAALDVARLPEGSRALARELQDRAQAQRRILDREVADIEKGTQGGKPTQKK